MTYFVLGVIYRFFCSFARHPFPIGRFPCGHSIFFRVRVGLLQRPLQGGGTLRPHVFGAERKRRGHLPFPFGNGVFATAKGCVRRVSFLFHYRALVSLFRRCCARSLVLCQFFFGVDFFRPVAFFPILYLRRRECGRHGCARSDGGDREWHMVVHLYAICRQPLTVEIRRPASRRERPRRSPILCPRGRYVDHARLFLEGGLQGKEPRD